MKRTLLLLLTLVLASAALGDERSEKRQLVSELLEVIDAKALLQASFESFWATIASGLGEESPEEMPEEYRAQWEEARRTQEQKLRDFKQRLFTHIDYAKYFDEVYVPLLEEQFTADELRHLIDFFRTRHGQKLAKVLPQLGIGATVDGMRTIREAAEATLNKMEEEEEVRNPWRRTMADLRMLATAVEARATDENEYPNVTFEELEALIAPTYIRVVPKVDSWGTPFLYVGSGEHYRFVSAGADRRFERGARQIDLAITEPKISDSLDADIIFQDGNFIQSPKEASNP
ncbi:MAG: DUF2059 domain-containing protein [Thermoanaerobaculia bacterium]